MSKYEKKDEGKKSLAIISSWHEPCGIAAYSERLKPEFDKFYNVEVLPLNTEILQNTSKNISKMGDQLIKEIAEKVKEFDYVNIQFEVGLFGVNRSQVFRRLMKIVDSSNNLIITFHSVNFDGIDINVRNVISRHPIKNLINLEKKNYWPRFYQNVFKRLRKLQYRKKINVIVHNKRDKELIKRITRFENVHDYPLALYTKDVRELPKTEKGKQNFKQRYHLSEADIVLGTFGFVSLYKGHETVIRALSHLPDNYKMVVFGGQHVRSIKKDTPVDKYLGELLDLIVKNKNKKLKDRVIFVGGVSDDDFLEAMRYSDFVLLPYLEVGQMASGVATMALESGSNIIMSNTNCFHELERYFPNCFKFFDIGNYMELARDILYWSEDYSNNIKKCLDIYNLENNVKNYMNIFEE